jgi:uncharacterized protein involved in exopolysaccharide biosynthesis
VTPVADNVVPIDGGAAERAQPGFRGDSKSIFVVFLELFFSRWMLICGIFFSAALWSYLALARAPDTYEATGQVLIKRGRVQSIQNVPIMRQQEEVGSEVDIMLSIAVLEETVAQLLAKAEHGGVADAAAQPLLFGTYPSQRPFNALRLSDLPLTDPAMLRKWLKSQLQLKKFGESNVIEVALIAVNPVFAAEAVNTMIEVYEKFNLRVESSPGQVAHFRSEIDKLDVEIDALQLQLAQYKEANGVVNVEKDRELMTLRRHATRTDLDKLQMEKTALETDLRIADDAKLRQHAAFIRNDHTIIRLREDIFERERDIAELRSKSTEDNPLLKQKLEELVTLKTLLDREEDLAVAQQKHVYQQLLDKERELVGKIAMLDRQLGAYPMIEAEIDALDRDIKQRTIKRIDVVEQMVKASTLEDPNESLNKVKVLGFAQVPPVAREARKGFKFLVAVILSAIAALVAGLFVEGLDHSVRKREEIEEQLNVPYLASLSSHLR